MERYRFSDEQLSLMEGMQMPFAIYQFINKRVVTLVLSDGFCELFGYDDRAEAYRDMDNDMYKDTHPDDKARIANAAFRFATEGGKYEVIYRTKKRGTSDYRMVHALGKHIYTEKGVRLAHVWYTDEGEYSDDGSAGSSLSVSLNSALHEESLIKASYYDHLTGLPSMTYFFELAEAGKAAIHSEGGNVVFLFIDMSGMKFFNQKHGFAAGDNLLREFSNLLASTFSNENCSHIGTDHFGVFTKEEGLDDVLKGLFRECAKLNGGESLPLRVGIYSTGMEDVPVSTACDRAKLACDSIRGTYASRFKYYTEGLRDDVVRKQYIIENLDKALKEGWIKVYYQPIIRAVDGRVCDEEALARWIDPEKGFLSPADFIPSLEEAGLIYKLDLYVVDRVLEKMKLQQEHGLTVVPHSVNLSRSDFDACDIVEEIRRRVDASGMNRDMITIEITESMIGSDFEFMKTQIDRFMSLGFPVWMDDFGSGYSSLDVLQSVKFSLLKFDMSFMRRLDEGENAKIILTELMKMATALGVDTVCEGVEKEEQVRFLQEIGCSKLQGYYYCKPIPVEALFERYRLGRQIGYENPEETEYYEAIGRVNLYDLTVIANEDSGSFHNFFNTLPMGIIELNGTSVRYVRCNQSYRDFIKRYFHFEVSDQYHDYSVDPEGSVSGFIKAIERCCADGSRVFYDEQMPDGSVVRSFIRRVGMNGVTGAAAVAVVVLSITDAEEGTTFASVAKSLAADYYNIFYIDLDTEKFIEYSSPVGGEELSMERHGEKFFEECVKDAKTRIHPDDRETFLSVFSKEKVVRELDQQGVFTTTYRLLDNEKPMYVNMKITRMSPGSNHIIMGISIIDAQMKQKEHIEDVKMTRNTLARVMALSEDYLTLYTVDPDTGHYIEYNATNLYSSLGLSKEGDDFFEAGIVNGRTVVYKDDLPKYLEGFTKERIFGEINKKGTFGMKYRLLIGGKLIPISLRIALVNEMGDQKLIAGVKMLKNSSNEEE